MNAEDYKWWIHERLNCEETQPMNLTRIQHRLDEARSLIEVGETYQVDRRYYVEVFGKLHAALQLLVNELARLQPEHPELTSSNKPSPYSEQAFKDFTQLLAARCAEFSEKTGKEETK